MSLNHIINSIRRQDIIDSTNKLAKVISESDLINQFNLGSNAQGGGISETLESFRLYSIQANDFNEIDLEILKIFNLDQLGDVKGWDAIFEGDPTRDELMKTRYNLMLIVQFLPKIGKMISQESALLEESKASKSDMKLMSFVLPEENNQTSNPKRLIEALESVDHFHSVVISLNKYSNEDLSVASIDSGSDKSFDFLGAAKMIESIKEIILTLWDRVIFFRERKLSERLDLIAKSLPIINQINDLEQKGSLEPEKCEILRRNIFEGSKKFLNSGIILPEFSSNRSFNPRQLMATEPKLLISRKEENQNTSEIEGSEEGNMETENLTKEEKNLLKKLLKKTGES